MATSTTNPGSGQKQATSSSSRFASLRVFKFAAGSSKHTPPIPPPKDNPPPTNNSSLSLVPDPTTPMTPVFTDYTRSQSTPPFSAAQSPSLSSQDPPSASSSTSFGKGLIKFAKRSLTPKSASRQLSESSEDSTISLPWGFQHNLHVDEGYNGMPPSWTASLASLGYSEEEIEAINYRRAASRAPSTVPFQHPNFPNLQSTSQLSIITTTTQNGRDRGTPSPSIRRQPSQASIQSRGTRRTRKMSTDTTRSRQSFYQSSAGNDSFGDLSYATDDHPPPLPSAPSIHLNGHKPKKSSDTLASASTNMSGRMQSPSTRLKPPHDFPPTPQSQLSTQAQSRPPSRPPQSRGASRDGVPQVGRAIGPSAFRPKTPPRSASQTFKVVNGDSLSQSPPPAYHLDSPPPISVMEKSPIPTSQPRQNQQSTPQPLLRRIPSTRQEQEEEKLRASVISTSTVTQESVQQDASEVSSPSIGDEEAGEEDDEPTSLPPLELSMSSLSMSPAVPAKKKKRYSLAPPRLSLGQDAFTDIGSWGDSLFESLSATPTSNDTFGASTSSVPVKKSAPALGRIGVEEKIKPKTSLSADAAGKSVASTLLATKEKRESRGPRSLTSQSSSLTPSPLVTTKSLPAQKTHELPQPSSSQPQPQALAQPQPRSGPTPLQKAVPVIPSPQPSRPSTATSMSSTTSSSTSSPRPKTRALPSTTRVADRFTPSPTPSPPRGRAGPESAAPPLPKTAPTNPLTKSQPLPPRERSSSRASSMHRPLPPQKPLPTLSLMSTVPLPNPPSHVELKSKISTVSLKAAAKRDREREREKEGEKVGKVVDVAKEKEFEKKEGKVKAKEADEPERWPMTAEERIALMASINHDNDGLDFGGKREKPDTLASADLDKTSTVSSDPHRDPHLSVDATQFDPNRLSGASAGSRGSTRSSNGGGLKLIINRSDYHNDNRDSNVSTSTITNATIVSGPVEVVTRVRADLIISPSPVSLGSPPFAGSSETTPKQNFPSVSNVDGATDDEKSRFGFGGRSPSPDSSTQSHSSSSGTTLSSTGPPSLSSANKATGFTQPVIKQHSGWEGEEGARRVVASSSSSPLPSPFKSGFEDESDEEGEDDEDIEIGDEEEDAVITRVSPPPGSGGGSTASLVDDISGHRRPSLVIPSHPSYSSMARDPLTAPSSTKQMLSSLNAPHSAGSGGSSPGQRYPGWVSEVLTKAGLEVFVDEKVEPREFFEGLAEVAEGESGFVYQAKVVRTVPGSKLTKRCPQPGGVIAIKAVPILPSGSSKLDDLRREVEVMKRVFEDDRSTGSPFAPASGSTAGAAHVLIMEAMYVDLQEDALWIRMELMERSLADVVALVEGGHLERIDEKVVARFASDIVQALSYLHGLGIAHRDVRSDNLLLNREGVLKIADFSNAVTISLSSPMCTGVVGVIFWQAPEVRTGVYNPTKADIWSLGATVWEMSESTPPFHEATSAGDLKDRWPPLSRAKDFSRSLHDFLILCSNPVASRPDVSVLAQMPFVRSAARRSAIVQILKKCRTIENLLMGGRPSVDSQGAFSIR